MRTTQPGRIKLTGASEVKMVEAYPYNTRLVARVWLTNFISASGLERPLVLRQVYVATSEMNFRYVDAGVVPAAVPEWQQSKMIYSIFVRTSLHQAL